ncbi:Esterase EstB [Tsuneonella dongtanensis]|uniref:Esterase EstB n=1 Tax=Tsuneonella dongtanensis TaxID=692370 RepID=A0A1B2ADV4_9SPHN|nr:serine hydrolase [Tsuneonella dongtanensis]ANY20342.1 Esterase EstB [Tsuneonella dongtanensis]
MAFRDFATPQMSRRSLLRSSALLGAGATMAGWPLRALAQGTTAWPAVEAMVKSYIDSRKVASMVATLGWGQAAPTMIGGGTLALGHASVAGPDTLYRIYSMTKPVTGMAAMQLIADGKLGLDQPIADLLPAFANMTVQKTYDGSLTDVEPAVRPITVRHLLTHTAGIGYGIIQKGPIKTAYEDAGIIAGQVTKVPALAAMFGRGVPVRSLAAFADGLAKLPLVAQPGTRWSYSMSLDLLGRVIEVASGMTFDAYLHEAIFGPAGMDSTYFQVPAEDVARLSTNYGVVGGNLIPIDPGAASVYADAPPFPTGGAGLVSSPADYDRFLKMIAGYGKIDGKRVLNELAVRVGTSNLLPDGVETKGTFAAGSGFGAGGRVGLGEQAGTYGWGGAAGTVALVDLKRGLRANLMTQYMPSDAYPVHAEFPAAVLKDLAAMAGK